MILTKVDRYLKLTTVRLFTSNVPILSPNAKCRNSYTQLFQKRRLDVLPFIAAPFLFAYFRFAAWKPRRDKFGESAGTIIKTGKYGNVQYKIIHPKVDEENKTSVNGMNKDIIVFFHGVPGGCDQYNALSNVTSFTLPFPVVSISRPGCLGTEFTQRSTITDISELHRYMLEDQLNLMDSSNRIHLLGFDRGGLYALHFAHTFPTSVSSLTLMSCATRLEGYRLALGTGGRTEYLEKDSLVGILEMDLSRNKKFISDLAEMVNTGAIRRGEKTSYEKLFRNEFLNSDDKSLLTSLATSYSSGTFFKTHNIPHGKNSEEYAFHFLRMLGMGQLYSKRCGFANDLCNVCNVEVDFEKTSRPSYKAMFEVAKKEAERKMSEPQETKNAGGTSWKSILEDVSLMEQKLRGNNHTREAIATDALICVDNEKYLSEIKCPTLILHSPEDGKINYNNHALHASKYIPNAQLEKCDLFPHTLPLNDPNHISKIITDFIQSSRC